MYQLTSGKHGEHKPAITESVLCQLMEALIGAIVVTNYPLRSKSPNLLRVVINILSAKYNHVVTHIKSHNGHL